MVNAQSLACMSCASKAGDKTGYSSFVPMGPDGKARYYGSRYEKTDPSMTDEKAVPPPEDPSLKKATTGANQKATQKAKSKSN